MRILRRDMRGAILPEPQSPAGFGLNWRPTEQQGESTAATVRLRDEAQRTKDELRCIESDLAEIEREIKEFRPLPDESFCGG